MDKVVLVGNMQGIMEWCRNNETNPKDVVKITSNLDQYKLRGLYIKKIYYVYGCEFMGAELAAVIDNRMC